MYAATIEGKVHYFAFKPNDALYSSVEDKLPKRAIAISPSGEIIQSVRKEFNSNIIPFIFVVFK